MSDVEVFGCRIPIAYWRPKFGGNAHTVPVGALYFFVVIVWSIVAGFSQIRFFA